MSTGFADVLRRHSKQVATLEGDHADEFLRLLKSMQETLQGRLVSAAGFDTTLDGFRIQSIIAETEAGIATLERKAKGQYDKAADEAVELAVEHAATELETMSMAFDAKRLEVSIDAVKVLADPAQRLLANHFATSVSRYGGDLLNGVRQRLFVALRTGDTVGQAARSIAGMQGPLGTVGRSNAERLVRTEVSQAYGAAQHGAIKQASKQVPGLFKTWIHVGSYLCSVCGPLHGTERPLDGTWTIRSGKKTRQVAHAPGHPRCTCRVVSMKKSWRTEMHKLGYLDKQPDDDQPGRASL